MKYPLLCCAAACACILGACGAKPATYADVNLRDVTLPGGQIIRAETMLTQQQLMRGMMFRDSLAPDHGMLFIYQNSGLYPSWTYQVKIPLDIVWMDASHRVVEMVDNVPPCTTDALQCPHYGGTKPARYVLELAGGTARKYGVQPGERIEF